MRLTLATVAALLTVQWAMAQSIPAPSPTGPGGTYNPPDILNTMATKQDVNADISGQHVTVAGAPVRLSDLASGASPMSGLNVSGGMRVTGAGQIAYVPRSSPIAGSLVSGNLQYTMNHSVQEFGLNKECDSLTVAPSLGGNVCDSTFMDLHAGSGGGWSSTDVVQMESGYNTGLYSTINHEFDINNLAGDYGEFTTANSVGLLLNGLGHRNTAGISIQTGNTAGCCNSGTLPIWFIGVSLGPNSVSDYGFRDQSNSTTSVKIQGTHSYGVDLADANVTGGALRLGNLGSLQGISVRVGSTNYSMLYADSVGQTHIGSTALGNIIAEGNVSPDTTGYSLGSTTNRWGVIWGQQINGVPIISVGTPTSSTATCVAGQQMVDSSYHYDCVAANTWRRIASSSF